MLFKGIKKQKGVTLLMSMLIMTTVVAVSIGVSMVIISQYQFSSNIDKSITAFYAAESGLELSLNTIKTDRNDITKTLTNAVNDVNTAVVPGFPSIGATWSISAFANEKYVLSYLKQNEKLTVDLFESLNNDLLGSGTGADVESLAIDWSDDCYGAGWLKLGYTAIKPNGDISTNPPYEKIYPCCVPPACVPCDPHATSCTVATTSCSRAVDNSVSPGYYYRLNITPISCNIKYLKIGAYDANDGEGNSQSFSNRLLIKSTGTKGTSKIALSADVAWSLPAQSIFDFVLFSDTANLVKE